MFDTYYYLTRKDELKLEVGHLNCLLRAERISKYFYNGNVVKSTSISINKGEIHVIEGKSGSGKSTLLSMLGGIEPPSQGSVFYKNKSLYTLPEAEQAKIRGNAFGFVFQAFHLIPEFTVRENIELPLHFLNVQNNELCTEEIARELDIYAHLDKYPNYLSGGEQQRVAIARAMITSPEIIFADEPTGNLDQKTTEKMMDVLVNLSTTKEVALVIVTHEQGLIRIPHFLYTMHDGVLRENGEHV